MYAYVCFCVLSVHVSVFCWLHGGISKSKSCNISGQDFVYLFLFFSFLLSCSNLKEVLIFIANSVLL